MSEKRPTPEEYPGLYGAGESGEEEELVHLYQGGEYGIGDIATFFQLGRLEDGPEGRPVLVLDRVELRKLKTQAAMYSFDMEEAFIEMCLEMERWGIERPDRSFRFTQYF